MKDKITINDIASLLYASNIDYNEIQNTAGFSQAMRYIWDIFIYLPRAIRYFNRVNIYNASDIDKLKFLRNFVKRAEISRTDLRIYFPRFEQRYNYKKELEKKYGTNDINTFYTFHKINVLNLDSIIKKPDRARPSRLSKEEKRLVVQKIEEYEEKGLCGVIDEDLFIPELTQDIINRLELTLFDIAILESTNEILYVFIDKDNRKRFYREPFRNRINFHPEPSLIKKDYFVSEQDTTPYLITDVKQYMILRKHINDNFKNCYPLKGL